MPRPCRYVGMEINMHPVGDWYMAHKKLVAASRACRGLITILNTLAIYTFIFHASQLSLLFSFILRGSNDLIKSLASQLICVI